MPSVGIPLPNFAAIEGYMAYAWGGGDGVIRGPGTEAIAVATDPPSMSVRVGAFKGFVSKRCIEMDAAQDTVPVTAPTGGSAGDLRRIDLVQFTLGSGLNVKAGTEDPAPVAPDPDTDSIPIAHLYLRNGATSIQTTDDTTNGYIVDRRVFR